jgi:7,8-dihydropterin-6-yl-methyl-4-(beta-D-ribofuranosyl)aminobenzene 5'-phosphate synthase
MNKIPDLELNIVFDNHPYADGMKTGWGFACLVRGPEKTILFDTGADGGILLDNLRIMGFSPDDIDAVFLSHIHKDHTGGLEDLLQRKPGLPVWLLESFPEELKKTVKQAGGSVHNVDRPESICPGVYTTGIIDGWIREQSLYLESAKGIVLLTGCAHPRIVNILYEVRRQTDKPVYMVMGGFHLAGFEKNEIQSILSFFQDNDVQKAGPAHCTGDEAIQLFKEAFQDNFLDIGVGRRVTVP